MTPLFRKEVCPHISTCDVKRTASDFKDTCKGDFRGICRTFSVEKLPREWVAEGL